MNYLYEVVCDQKGVEKFNSVPELLYSYKQTGVAKRVQLRAELQGQPELDGLCGPMYGGTKNDKTVIRYETPKMYEMLSN